MYLLIDIDSFLFVAPGDIHKPQKSREQATIECPDLPHGLRLGNQHLSTLAIRQFQRRPQEVVLPIIPELQNP